MLSMEQLYLTSKACCESNGAICALNLDAKRTQNIDSPASSRRSVFLPSRHRCRYGGINQPACLLTNKTTAITESRPSLPVATFHIVVVPSRTHAVYNICADGLDGGEGTRRRGSHAVAEMDCFGSIMASRVSKNCKLLMGLE